MFMFKKSLDIPSAADALPGRPNQIRTAATHFVNGNPLKGPYPAGFETAIFGFGCFWGAERKFWELGDGIYVTAVGRRVVVVHAFVKKTQKTPRAALELAARRAKEIKP